MCRVQKRNGFTLIEILIAITILLAVSFIGLLKYVDVVEENHVKVDLINAKTIADGVQIAILSNAIEGKDATNQSIANEKLSNYFDTTITPKSKQFGGTKSAFTYSISGKNVTVTANGIQAYPYIAP